MKVYYNFSRSGNLLTNTEVLKGVDLEAGAGRIYHAVRCLRLRQDHDAADHCGVWNCRIAGR